MGKPAIFPNLTSIFPHITSIFPKLPHNIRLQARHIHHLPGPRAQLHRPLGQRATRLQARLIHLHLHLMIQKMIKNASRLKKEKDPRKSEKILINREFLGISSLEILIDVPKEKKSFLSCKVNNNNRKYMHTFLA